MSSLGEERDRHRLCCTACCPCICTRCSIQGAFLWLLCIAVPAHLACTEVALIACTDNRSMASPPPSAATHRNGTAPACPCPTSGAGAAPAHPSATALALGTAAAARRAAGAAACSAPAAAPAQRRQPRQRVGVNSGAALFRRPVTLHLRCLSQPRGCIAAATNSHNDVI